LFGSLLKVYLPVNYRELHNPPTFARDVSSIGHWGVGDLELRISNQAELDASAALVRQSFEAVKAATGGR
jgi:predicted transport protein